MRSHYLTCLRKRGTKPFPKKQKAAGTHTGVRIIRQKKVNVYCVCRQPMKKPMVACDACGEWFYDGCVEVKDNVCTDEKVKWYCTNCD